MILQRRREEGVSFLAWYLFFLVRSNFSLSQEIFGFPSQWRIYHLNTLYLSPVYDICLFYCYYLGMDYEFCFFKPLGFIGLYLLAFFLFMHCSLFFLFFCFFALFLLSKSSIFPSKIVMNVQVYLQQDNLSKAVAGKSSVSRSIVNYNY